MCQLVTTMFGQQRARRTEVCVVVPGRTAPSQGRDVKQEVVGFVSLSVETTFIEQRLPAEVEKTNVSRKSFYYTAQICPV